MTVGMDIYRVGQIVGEGVILMGSERPRPERESAVAGVLTDPTTPYVSVGPREHITVSVKVDVAAAEVEIQGCIAGDPDGPWHTLKAASLDGSVDTDDDFLQVEGAFRWIRVATVSGTDPAAEVTAYLYAF